jgi:hypothetical protein
VARGIELFSIRVGPDRLARITTRRLGETVSRSLLVPSTEAEDVVLDEWAELHDRVLGTRRIGESTAFAAARRVLQLDL